MPGSGLFLQTIDAVYASGVDSARRKNRLQKRARTHPQIRRVERTIAIELTSAGQRSAPQIRNIPPKRTTASRIAV
jgi:hypothetical protein